jgi:hypothetical protein
MKKLLFVFCIVAMLVGCGDNATTPVSTIIVHHLVLFKAEASDFQSSSASWYNSGSANSPSGSAGFTGTWAQYFPNVTAGTNLSLTVSGANPAGNPWLNPSPVRGNLTATIIVDGNVWKQEFAAGVSASATASGTIP